MGKGLLGRSRARRENHLKSLQGKKNPTSGHDATLTVSSNPEVVGTPLFDCPLNVFGFDKLAG